MKTPERITQASPPEPQAPPVKEDAEAPSPIDAPSRDNPWREMETAPHDRIIEGRLGTEEVGQPIRWRNSRRRVGPRWIDAGVWHSAELRGAVELHPIAWRAWFPVPLRFDAPEALDEDEAA